MSLLKNQDQSAGSITADRYSLEFRSPYILNLCWEI